jgi:hypothetical protein
MKEDFASFSNLSDFDFDRFEVQEVTTGSACNCATKVKKL